MAVRPPSASDLGSDSGHVRVPDHNKDPVWSLRPWPVLIFLAGQQWEIPAQPAADWLAVLMTEKLDPGDVFPGMLAPEDEDALDDLIVNGTVGAEELWQTFTEVIGIVTARSWWIGLRLIEIARSAWNIVGAELILQGIDPERLSLAAWLDALMIIVLRNMEPKETTMFTMRLEAPPAGEESEEDEGMSREAFLAMPF